MSPDSSTRVRWLGEGATPISEMGAPVGAFTPIDVRQSSNTTSEEGGSIGQLQRAKSNIASAVANVVAETSAAAVLHDVARGAVTPLQAMALPKLHRTVPSTVKKASFISSVAAAEGDEPGHGRGEDIISSLESVRRRQSFSSIAIPQGSICE